MSSRRKRPTHTEDFGGVAARIIRAYGRRVGQADATQLAGLISLREVLEESIADAVTHLREDHDFTWATIAEATGTTRQAAQQRWGRAASA